MIILSPPGRRALRSGIRRPEQHAWSHAWLLRDIWTGELAQVVRGTINAGQIPARQGRVWLVVEAASEAGQD